MAEITQGLTNEERILAERSRALARPPHVEADGEHTHSLVAFAVGGERYGIEIGFVQEIQPLPRKAFCRLPCVPLFVAGIVNIRGRIHTVIDVGVYFGLAPRPLAEAAHVLLIRTSGNGGAPVCEVGILADERPETLRIERDDLRPPPETVAEKVRGLIHGVSEEMMAFLDLEKLLMDPGMIVRDGE